jgi:hypothetical protein
MMIKIYVIFKYITFYAKQTLATHLFNTIKKFKKKGNNMHSNKFFNVTE